MKDHNGYDQKEWKVISKAFPNKYHISNVVAIDDGTLFLFFRTILQELCN